MNFTRMQQWTTRQINSIIVAISERCKLHTLKFNFYPRDDNGEISFAPLLTLRSLRAFALSGVSVITDTNRGYTRNDFSH